MSSVCRSLVRPRKALLSSSVATVRLLSTLSRPNGLHRGRKLTRKCAARHLPPSSCHASTTTSSSNSINDVPLSPAVRYHVDTNKIIDTSVIPATGPSNRLLKGDVLQYLEDLKAGKIVATTTTKPVSPVQKAPPVAAGTPPRVKYQPMTSPSLSYVDIPVDETRRVAAEREVYSKWSTPYSYATVTCNVDRIVEAMERTDIDDDVLKPSLDDFIIRAAGLTLQDVPESNGVWSGDGVRLSSSIDISVSVCGKEEEEGVCRSGVVRGVNRLTVDEIVTAVKSLSSPSAMTSQGSFSIVSLGSSGVTEFTSILPAQHSAILSVGSLYTAPSLTSSNITSHYIIVTLTSDPRVMHYALACRWLKMFKRTLELAV